MNEENLKEWNIYYKLTDIISNAIKQRDKNRMGRARVKIRICHVVLQYADNLIDYMGYWGFQCTNTIFTQMQEKKLFNSSPENQGWPYNCIQSEKCVVQLF